MVNVKFAVHKHFSTDVRFKVDTNKLSNVGHYNFTKLCML